MKRPHWPWPWRLDPLTPREQFTQALDALITQSPDAAQNHLTYALDQLRRTHHAPFNTLREHDLHARAVRAEGNAAHHHIDATQMHATLERERAEWRAERALLTAQLDAAYDRIRRLQLAPPSSVNTRVPYVLDTVVYKHVGLTERGRP